MKKIKYLSLLLVVATLLTCVPMIASAEKVVGTSYEVMEDFSSKGINSMWTQIGTSVYYSDETAGIHADGEGISTTLSEPLAKDEILEVEFVTKAAGVAGVALVNGDKTNVIIAHDYEYRSYTEGATHACVIHHSGAKKGDGTWDDDYHTITYKFDGFSNTFDIYEDGVKVGSNLISIYQPTGDNHGMNRFNFEGVNGLKFIKTTLAYGATQPGSVRFDNISVKRLKRVNYAPVNFSTDFSELNCINNNYFNLPNGFTESIVPRRLYGKVVDEARGTSLVIDGYSAVVHAGVSFNTAVTEGTVTVEFDQYSNGVTNALHLKDPTETDTHIYSSNPKSYNAATADAWVHCKFIADFNSNSFKFYFGDELAKDTTLPRVVYNNGLKGFCFVNWSGASGNYIYLDNLSVKAENAPTQDLGFDDDFDDYTTVAGTKPNWTHSAGIDDTCCEIVGTDDKEFKLGVHESEGTSMFERNIGGIVTKGKVKTSFDINVTAGNNGNIDTLFSYTNKPHAADTKIGVALSFDRNSKVASGRTDNFVGEYTMGEWYNCTITADLSQSPTKVTVVVKDSNGAEIVNKTNNLVLNTDTSVSLDEIQYIRLQTYPKSTGGYTSIDNVIVEYISDVPSLGNVTFNDVDGNATNNYIDVTPETKSIDIDFGTFMTPSTITDNTLYLENITDGGKVEYAGELNGSVYTMNFENLLLPGKDYRLTLTNGAKNVQGTASDEELQFVEFNTKKGAVDAVITSVKINNVALTDIAQIATNNVARVDFELLNTTDKDLNVYLIYSYYKEGQLTYTHYKNFPLTKDVKEMAISVPQVLAANTQGADTVKVFLWDGFDTMVPLALNYSFPAAQ